jgi:hypothetical protein
MTAVCAMVTAMQIFAVRLRAHGNILLPCGRKRLMPNLLFDFFLA